MRREPARGQTLSQQPPVACRFSVTLQGVASIRRSSGSNSGGGTSWTVRRPPIRGVAPVVGVLSLELPVWRPLPANPRDGPCSAESLPEAKRFLTSHPLAAALAFHFGGGPDSMLVGLRFGGWHQLDGSSASDSGGGTSWALAFHFGGWPQLGARRPSIRGVAPVGQSAHSALCLALSAWRSLPGALCSALSARRSLPGALWLALSGWRSLVGALSGASAVLTAFVEFGLLNLRFSYCDALCLSCPDTWRSLPGALCVALSVWRSLPGFQVCDCAGGQIVVGACLIARCDSGRPG